MFLVRDTGIEPVTSSVSGKRATAAPIALATLKTLEHFVRERQIPRRPRSICPDPLRWVMFLLVGSAPKAKSSDGDTPDGQARKGMKSCDKVSARKNGALSSRASIDRQCGRSSAGRASPCHGEGRGFDSRRPLAVFDPGRDLRPCPPRIWSPVGWPSG